MKQIDYKAAGRIFIRNKSKERKHLGRIIKIYNRPEWTMRISLIPNIIMWAYGKNTHIPDGELFDYNIDEYKYNYGLNIDWLFWNIYITL